MSKKVCILTGLLSVVFWGMPWTGVRAEDAYQISEKPAAGDEYHVSVRVELAGKLTLPGGVATEPLRVSGQSRIDYDERLLEVTPAGVPARASRIYQDVQFARTIGARTQQETLRPAIRRLVLIRRPPGGYAFSPDGALTSGELDLIRTDVFVPALAR